MSNLKLDLWQRLNGRVKNIINRADEDPDFTEDDTYPVAPEQGDAEKYVPMGVQVTAAWAWRALVIAGAAGLVLWILGHLSMVVIPVAVALLFTAVLNPVVRVLHKYLRLPRALASLIALLFGIGVFTGIVSLAVSQILSDAPDLVWKTSFGFSQLTDWLSNGPLGFSENQVSMWLDQGAARLQNALQANATNLANGAFWAASSVGNFMAMGLTVLFCIFFFLHDGKAIWLWVVRILPRDSRRIVHESVSRGWTTVGAWARVQMLVAAIDAIGIGAGAYFLGVSLWAPIALLTFLASFIPIVGAIVAGTVAVLVAVVDVGVGAAVAMAVIVLVVQQMEGNVLQPLLMASAVSLHPVAVLLGVTAGGYLLGILGALFTVPVMAFLNAAILYARSSYSRRSLSGVTDKQLGLATSPDRLVDAFEDDDRNPRDAYEDSDTDTDRAEESTTSPQD